MRDTRFIFVEGIMGAGKTTAAEFLTNRLHRNGIAARFLPEGPTTSQRAHPLRVGPTLSPVRTAWYDITIEEYVALSLEKWRAFSNAAEASAPITVCDGLLFHGNMTDLLLMDAEPQVLHRYVTAVVESIACLNPTLIYLRHADVAHALRAVCDERGSEWEAMQVAWKVGSPYGVRRSLQGFEGLTALYQRYGATCDDLYARLVLPKVAVVRDGDWARGYGDILAFLELRPSSEASDFPTTETGSPDGLMKLL
ncbi:MAG: hypothetical protein ACR2JW_10985 [Thermomicrobiales bacterium]